MLYILILCALVTALPCYGALEIVVFDWLIDWYVGNINHTLRDVSAICQRRRRRHMSWLAMSNDMATCVAHIVDIEEQFTDLQFVFVQVISAHLYCWWMLSSIRSVSSLSIVNKSNVIAKTVRNTQGVWVQQHLDNQYLQIIYVFLSNYIFQLFFTHHNFNLFNGITYICTIVLTTTVQNGMTEYISYIYIHHDPKNRFPTSWVSV